MNRLTHRIVIALLAFGLGAGAASTALGQTIWNSTTTGGAWSTGANWSNGVPGAANAATISMSPTTAVLVNLTSATSGSTSGLDITNNGTANIVVRSFQTATTETQTLAFDKTAAGNVQITTSGSGTGNITLRGRFTLTDSIDVTANKALLFQLDANSGGLGFQGSGGINILHGTVSISRNGTDTITSRALSVGDSTGAAGSAILRLSQSNMFATASGGFNATVTVKPDGLLDLTNATGTNIMGSDTATASQLNLHGGGQVSQTTGGTLVLRGSGAIPVLQVASAGSSSTATISGAGTLQLDLSTATSTGTRGISIAKNAAAGVSDLTISTAISDGDDNMSYTKTGTGILAITSNNTSTLDGTGTWNIQAGGLLVNNTSGSATGGANMSVDIGADATLGGTGTIAGNVSISGTHNPGNSPGVQNFGNNLTYNADSSVNWELNGNSVTQGAGTIESPYTYDQITVGGTLSFAGSTALNLSFNGDGSTVNWNDAFWSSNRQWQLYSSAAVVDFGNLSLTSTNWQDSNGALFETLRPGSSFALSTSDNNVYLNYTAIPEPSTYAALAGLAVLCGVMIHRRRKAKI